jgi:hypothetical protein
VNPTASIAHLTQDSLQCLVKCVRAGSTKKATKALTDAHLKPTLRLVEYAGNRSREKQSLLLRDLKLGVNHIDRAQLRRNGLLNPRYPTELVELSATVENSIQTTDERGGDFFGASATAYKIRCVAKVRVVALEEDLDGDTAYRLEDGTIGRMFREEWVIYRPFKDFQALHKQLKTQVSAAMSSGSAGSRLVDAATAAFANTSLPQSRRQRQPLIPSLSQASKAGALGVTKKSILKRQEVLNGYIGYILSTGHLMCRCSEILLFLGAFHPFSSQVRVGGEVVTGVADPLGRTEMSRRFLQERVEKTEANESKGEDVAKQAPPPPTPTTSVAGEREVQDDDALDDGEERDSRKSSKTVDDMIPSIRGKIEKIPLAQVRNRLFELLRYQFGFENASFIRNRMLAALKTASFAVTTASEFRKTLYKLHTEHLSADAIAGWIQFGCDLLWPDGVFFESAPAYSQEKLDALAAESKQVLHDSFPEQVRVILGNELTEDGMDIFHEMLQNRVVVRSMSYMMFDLFWLEVFPEIGDVLQCGAALDIDQ